jgi:hypothetical protein
MKKNVKIVEPRIYALLLEAPEIVTLTLQTAYSLEEAFMLAKEEFEENNPHLIIGTMSPLSGSKINLFTSKSLKEILLSKKNKKVKIKSVNITDLFSPLQNLSHRHMGYTIPEEKVAEKTKGLKEKENKNFLMKEIIKTKDKKKLNRNKNKFNKEEIKYLREHIEK